jgi:hypothetical protein
MIEDMPATPPDAIAHRFEASGLFVGEHAQKIIALVDRGLVTDGLSDRLLLEVTHCSRDNVSTAILSILYAFSTDATAKLVSAE